MSHQPPGPPPGPPPYGPPPGYGPPPRPSRTVPLLVGALLGGIDLVVTTILGLGIVGNYATAAGFVLPALGLLVPVALLFSPATRWWGVGLLLGYFLTLIVLGGACVALIAGLS